MSSAFALRMAALVVRHGGIVAYPTEAVYGLGCDPLDGAAVARLLALKRRPQQQGLIVIASGFEQLAPYLAPVSAAGRRKIEARRPVTWVAPAAPSVPAWITGTHETIAVRITRHPLARALCLQCGHAVISTSANHSGRPPARTALGVRLRFGEQIDQVLSGPVGTLAAPTPIRDLATGEAFR